MTPRPCPRPAALTGARAASVAALLALLLLAFASSPAAAAERPRAGEVIVRLGGEGRQALAADARTALSLAAVPGGSVARVAVPAGEEDRAAADLRAQPGVLWAEPNRPMRRLDLAEPSAEPERWREWHLSLVNAEWAWAFTRGDPGVKVAVVDSGVDASHPDRPAHLEIGPAFATGGDAGVDHDGHGTHVAGTIAAPINGRGTVGLAPDVTVLALKVDGDDGAIYVYDVYRAILYAVDHGARVVNLSLGTTDDSAALRDAVAYARAHGVLVVAAAGNSHDDGNPVVYPAAYPGVLAVGAATLERERAPYSETGDYVALLAPGGRGGDGFGDAVYGPLPDGRYGAFAGTSAAAPLASAAAALVLSIDPSLGVGQVRDRLVATAQATSDGAGLLDADTAARATAARFPYRALARAPICPAPVAAGGATSATFVLGNAGGATWPRGTVWLTPADAATRAFFTPERWASPGRAGRDIDDAAPGGLARVEVPLAAPAQPGTYRATFHAVLGSGAVPTNVTVSCDVRVLPGAPWLAADVSSAGPGVLAPGARGQVVIRLRNVGTETWHRSGPTPFRLGTQVPWQSPFYDRRTWFAPTRPALLVEEAVSPGQFGTFEFDVVAPDFEGHYQERLAPLVENVEWLDNGIVLDLRVAR